MIGSLPIPTTSADYVSTGKSNKENIDRLMVGSHNESGNDKIDSTLGDQACFCSGQDEKGPDVSERIAKVTDQALRGTKTKGDENKLKDLAKTHKCPKKSSTCRLIFQRLQLKRETKTIDFIQRKVRAKCNFIMMPVVTALDLIN